MAAEVTVLDAAGNEVSLDSANPLDFGTVDAGTTGGPVELQVKNTGTETLYFVEVRGVKHPTAHVGSETDTKEAVEFSVSQDGAYADVLELGALAVDEVVSVWARWVVPDSAAAGDAVWAVEAAGVHT